MGAKLAGMRRESRTMHTPPGIVLDGGTSAWLVKLSNHARAATHKEAAERVQAGTLQLPSRSAQQASVNKPSSAMPSAAEVLITVH